MAGPKSQKAGAPEISTSGLGTGEDPGSPEVDYGSNDLNKKLAAGVIGEYADDGAIWLNSEFFTGTISAGEASEGLSTLALFEAQEAQAQQASADADPAFGDAFEAGLALDTFDAETWKAKSDSVVGRISAMTSVRDDWDDDSATKAERFWWVRHATAAADAHDALAIDLDTAMSGVGEQLVLPGTTVDGAFPDFHDRTTQVEARQDYLQPFMDTARALIDGEATTVDGLDEDALTTFETTWFGGLAQSWERAYLLDAMSDGGAAPLALAKLAASMGLALPAGVTAQFGSGEQDNLDAAWNNEDIRAWGGTPENQLGQDMVLDLLTWQAKGDNGTLKVADLLKFERFLQNSADGAYTRFRVPDLGGEGLPHALAAVNLVHQSAKDGDYLTAKSNVGRAESALNEVVAQYSGVAGTEDLIGRIKTHRDNLASSVGVGRAADALIAGFLGGESEEEELSNIDEQAYFKTMKTAAVNARKAYFEMSDKLAGAVGKGLSAPGAVGPELTVNPPAAGPPSTPLAFGQVSLGTISLLAEANSFAEMCVAISADTEKSKGQKATEAVVGVAKLGKAIAETITGFMEAFSIYSGNKLQGLGMVAEADAVFAAAKSFSSAAGKVFAVAGLCIAAVELALAIQTGDPDKIVAASAGFANAGVGAAGTFGLITMETSMILNIVVLEAVAAYYVCKNLPKIAQEAQRIDIKENSRVVVTNARDAMEKAREARAASRAWQSAVLTDPTLAKALETRMGSALHASWNGVSKASGAALRAPAGLDASFRDHVTFGDLMGNAPPKEFTGSNLHIFMSGYQDFLKDFRYGIEDMTDKGLLATGNIGNIEYMSRTAERTVARSEERDG